ASVVVVPSDVVRSHAATPCVRAAPVHITAPTETRGVKPAPVTVTDWPSVSSFAGLTVTGSILVPSPSVGLPGGRGRRSPGTDAVGGGAGADVPARLGRNRTTQTSAASAATSSANSHPRRSRPG